jgi:hypothetical protein
LDHSTLKAANRLRRVASALLCLAGTATLVSCSDKDYAEVPVYPASGTLTVEGEPAYGAYVTFHPVDDVGMTKGNRPFSRVSEGGTFTVTTYDTGDGLPEGKYDVTVTWPEDPEARGPSPDRLDGQYADPKSSGLQVTIDKDGNESLGWDLER